MAGHMEPGKNCVKGSKYVAMYSYESL